MPTPAGAAEPRRTRTARPPRLEIEMPVPGSGGELPAAAPPPARRIVLEPWGPHELRWGFLFLGAFYIAMVWFEAVGSKLPGRILSRPLHYFTQSAALFTRAAVIVTEWRVRGYNCAHQKFEEIDVDPYFPIHPDDKENRFDRAMHFYFQSKRVLKALDRYITKAESALGEDHRIGGVMLLSLRLPIPKLGGEEEEYEPKPIDAYPPEIERKVWYITDKTLRERRCAEAAAGGAVIEEKP